MADDPTVPDSLVKAFHGRYEILRETGRGGSATVYLARDLKHDRYVAIKVLASDVAPSSGERFLREIRVSAGMQHPHILPIYDSGLADGRLYFVMPFVDGGSLRDRLSATMTALPLDESLRIAHDIGIALMHAHELGIIHRDVKPENILFYHGTACLADFGIARTVEQLEPGLTGHGMIVGTPAYMSPEQYSASGFDGRSDVYSLASVLHEMIAGARLFPGSTMQEVMAERVVPSLPKPRPGVPDYIVKVLDRGLATSPADRFPDARSFVAAIEDALQRGQDPVSRDSAPRRALVSMKRNKLAYGIGAAALAILIWPLGMRGSLDRGHSALAAWDAPAAQQAFAAAVAADSSAAEARVWLAESYALARRLNRDEFKLATMPLAKGLPNLRGRDSTFAVALLAFAAGSPASACDAYTRQLQRDSADVLAWYGMGDCQYFDSTVVRDSTSPSGWRFASSFHSAAHAYIHTVTLDPNAHAALPYGVLTSLLPFDVSKLRIGVSRGPPRETFYAYPALVADTLAFVPYPLAEFSSVRPSTISPTQPLALRRNRDVLLDVARQWTVASPRNANAWEALALAREGRGEVGDGDEGAGSAITRARALATTPLQQTNLAAAQVRMYVKRGDFRTARRLTDSILAAWRGKTPDPAVAEPLYGLAALTGRVQLAAIYTTASSSQSNEEAPLTALADRFFSRAAPGVCDDTLGALRRDYERVLTSYAAPNQRDQVRKASLSRAAALAFPCLGGAALGGIAATDPLDRAQRAFAAHDVRRTRMLLDSLTGVRAGYRPGDISLDHTVQEAWLRAAVGDTAGAAGQLDLVLEALPTLSSQAVSEVAQSAAVGRAMVLRADLAAARHDAAGARRWSTAALDLWSSADPSLKATLDRMRALSVSR